MRKYPMWLLLAGILMLPGCSSGGSSNAWYKSLGFRSSQRQLSPETRLALRELSNPKATLLTCARQLENTEQYAEARQKYHEIQIAFPDCVEAELGLARIEMATGRTEQAEEILHDVLAKDDKNVAARLQLGHLYSEREDWNLAIAQFQRACDDNPDDQLSRYELGIALARSGQDDQALPHLKFAVGESAAMYNVGYLHFEAGHRAEAVNWFQQALQRHPDEQTATRTRELLASMDIVPASNSPSAPLYADRMVAGSGSRAGMAASPQITPSLHSPRPAGTTADASAQSQSVSQYPVSAGSGIQTVGMQLPAAGSPIPVRPATMTTSYNPDDALSGPVPGRAQLAQSEPPGWNGPTGHGTTTSSVSASGATTDPPGWRARGR